MRYAQDYHVVDLLLTSDTDTAALPFVNMSNYLWCDFLLGIGELAGDSIDVTVECCSANSTSGATLVALPFKYRITSGVNSDTIGLVTSATSAGLGLDSDNGDNVSVIVGIGASQLESEYNYVRVKIAQGANTSGFVAQCHALLTPRYAGGLMPSST